MPVLPPFCPPFSNRGHRPRRRAPAPAALAGRALGRARGFAVCTLPLAALLAALLAAACATAPPPAPPAPTWEQKLADIIRLEDARVLREPAPPAPAPVATKGRRRGPIVLPPAPPDLVVMLGDLEGRVRRRAALAIGRVGLAEGVDPLAGALAGDADAEVREMAAFALGILGDASAVPALRAAIDDPALAVQGRAAEALGLLDARDAAEAIGTMVARHAASPAVQGMAPDDLSMPVAPEAEAFRLGVYALTRLKAWDPFGAAVLDANGMPRVRWWPVVYALGRMERAEALPALRWWLTQPGVEGVAFALRGVGALKDTASVDTLLSFVDPASRPVRHVAQAIRSLGQIGDVRAAERLEKLLLDRGLDVNLRLETLDALAALRAQDALDVVLDHLVHPSPVVRGAAMRAAARIDPEGFVPVLSGLDADGAWSVRRDLAGALASLPLDLASPRLSLLVDDEDPRVKAAALDSLSKLDAPGIEARLIEALGHASITVRSAAAAELGRRKSAAAAEALAAAWSRGSSDDDYEARISALEALVAVAPERARPLVEQALADGDWAVRRRAAAMAAALTPPLDASSARPAPTSLSRDDYADPAIVAPAYSPHAYVETARGTIEIELAVLDAPLTVRNFVRLARAGFFDGMAVHRVVPNFVVQAGDNRGDGSGGPGYTIRDEINTRPYLRGTVGMALAGPDTGGSQWFITHGPQPHLDGRYTVFGRVVAGMDVVDRLVRGDVIERVRVWDGTAWE